MTEPHRRGQDAVLLGAALTGQLVAGSVCAFALDPELDISQYWHTARKVREGFSKGPIHAVAQAPDAYLWLSTEFGVLRLHGVKTVPWQPPKDQDLPSNVIPHLLATRDLTLWIGTGKGVASEKVGKFTQYAELAGRTIFGLIEGREGTVWAGDSGAATGTLCSIRNGESQC